MRLLRLIVAATLCSRIFAVAADDAAAWVAEGLAAEARHDPTAALVSFRAALALRPDDPEILQKIAKQLSDATFGETDETKKQRLVAEALTYAQRAAALAPDNAENVLSLAVLYGKLGIYADTGDKIEYARLIQQFAEKALALDPEYAWAHHVLGQWHLAMAELGATKRFLAGLFYGGLPRGSQTIGFEHLKRAVELEPDVLAHRAALGLACQHVGQTAEARGHWEVALTLPVREIHDRFIREQVIDALSKIDGTPAAS